MHKLLILGAGIYQVPLIKQAQKMGLYVIAASCAGNYPGLALADEVWNVDTTNDKQLVSLASHAGISGVCTSGTDVAVYSLGKICEALGLRGVSSSCAEIVTDKALMKDAFYSGNVSTPKAIRAYSLSDAENAFDQLKAPVILKAVDRSGSRGITRVNHFFDLDEAFQSARSVTKKNYILVEKFLQAQEIGVDGFVSDGKIQFMVCHDKFTLTANKTTLPEGHHFPYYCSSELELEIHKQIERAIHTVGMNHCAFNADVLISENHAYILEIGARAGATCIPELISIYCGFNYYEQMICYALDKPVNFTCHQPRPCMAKLLFSRKSGIITEINYKALSELSSSGADISLDYKAGSCIEAVENGTSRIGQVILETDDTHNLNELMSKVRQTIKVNGVDLETIWRT